MPNPLNNHAKLQAQIAARSAARGLTVRERKAAQDLEEITNLLKDYARAHPYMYKQMCNASPTCIREDLLPKNLGI